MKLTPGVEASLHLVKASVEKKLGKFSVKKLNCPSATVPDFLSRYSSGV